jgi:hypothetical protein
MQDVKNGLHSIIDSVAQIAGLGTAATLNILAAAAIILAASLLTGLFRFAPNSSRQVSAYLLKQAGRVFADRIAEMLVIFVLLELAGVPGAGSIMRFLLALFDK